MAGWRLRGAAAPAQTVPAGAARFVAPLPPPLLRIGHAPAQLPARPAGPAAATTTPDGVVAALRARASRGGAGVPAAEVDRWILRWVTEPERRRELEDGLGRMARYEPLVRESLRRHGQPEELLYLAVVESQFRVGAVSHAGATGMWQFMAGTGRLYDLEVSEYVDERRDPVRSTEAAVRHLADLHREFGSWHLALAAYNAGAARVDRALRRHAGGRRGDELLYWRIRPHLPRETRTYVPLYLAAAEIARSPEAFGLRPRRQPPLVFAEVWVPGGVALDAVAREHGVPAATLRELNPHLIRGTTPPGRRWPVRVPPSYLARRESE
jgi:membrane-bound lytic murein transglycosylase D